MPETTPTPVPSQTWRHHRARVAHLARFEPENQVALAAERTALRRTKIVDDVRRAIATVPLTDRTDLAIDLLRVVLPERGAG